jgi:hypothetical protein
MLNLCINLEGYTELIRYNIECRAPFIGAIITYLVFYHSLVIKIENIHFPLGYPLKTIAIVIITTSAETTIIAITCLKFLVSESITLHLDNIYFNCKLIVSISFAIICYD